MDKITNNNNRIDSEQNTLQRLENDLKNTIFGVNFILLKGQEISIYTTFVLYIIQFLQIIVFAFHDTVIHFLFGIWFLIFIDQRHLER